MVTSYVALLRGINLARTRRVAMSDLRGWLADLGYEGIRTHLQSGNVVFASDKRPDAIARELEARLAEETGFAIGCVLRTAAELRAVVDADPLGEVVTNPSRYMVTFMASAPGKDWRARMSKLDPAAYEPERFHVGERELFTWTPDGIRDSKLMRDLAAIPSTTVVTARNWNTVTKLLALAGE
jgi:uncharacterized protein (DUF1697 family)